MVIKMRWVIVNYSVESKNETFFVSENEEKTKKKKSSFKKILKTGFALVTVIFNISKLL